MYKIYFFYKYTLVREVCKQFPRKLFKILKINERLQQGSLMI